jgi:capsid assembly protease
MKYLHIISDVMTMPLAIRREKFDVIWGFLMAKANGEVVAHQPGEFPPPAEPYLVECDGSVEIETTITGDGVSHVCSYDPRRNVLHPKASTEFCNFCNPPRITEVTEAAGPNSESRSRAGAIAVLPLHGTIAHRMGMMSDMSGGTSTEKFTQWFRAAMADPMVKSIVIDVDSPGGGVPGVQELGDEIFQARGTKPVVAVANAQAASAAYWLASQAQEFVVTPSGEVGSIGVFAMHRDVSKALEAEGVTTTMIAAGKYKVEGNPYQPLSEEARQSLQTKIGQYYSQFVNAVARGRGTSADNVTNNFGEGRMLMAKDALKAGMVDRVATLDRTLQRMGAKQVMKKSATAAESEVPAIDQKKIAEDRARRLNLRKRQLALHGA